MYEPVSRYDGRAKPPTFYFGGLAAAAASELSGVEIEVPTTIAGIHIVHWSLTGDSSILQYGVDDAAVLVSGLTVISPLSVVNGALRVTARSGRVTTPPADRMFVHLSSTPTPRLWVPGGRRFYATLNTANVIAGIGVFGWEEDLA
jgi:hypothetical protein